MARSSAKGIIHVAIRPEASSNPGTPNLFHGRSALRTFRGTPYANRKPANTNKGMTTSMWRNMLTSRYTRTDGSSANSGKQRLNKNRGLDLLIALPLMLPASKQLADVLGRLYRRVSPRGSGCETHYCARNLLCHRRLPVARMTGKDQAGPSCGE